MLSGPFIHLPANGKGWSSCYFNIKSGLHLKRMRNHDLTCSWLKGLLEVLHSIQWGSVRQALRRTKLCSNLHVYNSCRTCFLHFDIFHDIKIFGKHERIGCSMGLAGIGAAGRNFNCLLSSQLVTPARTRNCKFESYFNQIMRMTYCCSNWPITNKTIIKFISQWNNRVLNNCGG